ncbi:MAG: hypothetical protein WA172_19240 [Terriglobales bacterium]
MAITVKVKKTGQVFNATNEWDAAGFFGRDAHELVEGKVYGGHLFHTHELRESSDMVELVFTGIEWATFRAEELEDFAAGRIRLRPRFLPRD